MLTYLAVLSLSALAVPQALAQQTAWGQCGGQGWTGATTCVSGWTCVYSNPWYSQCLQASSTPTSTSSSSSKSSSSSSRSSSSSSRTSSSSSRSSSSSSRTSTSSAPVTSATGKYWFSFGDSYTQTGFTVTGTQPSSSNAFGNPTYPGYTACGSYPNWIDYAAVTLNTTLVKVYNHAYGGATIDSALVTPYTSTVKCLDDQVADYLTYNAPGKTYYPGWSASNTLFSIWVGINDIGNTYWQGTGLNDSLLNRYFELVQQLYATGARHFLFLTVPPVYRSPLMLSQASTARDQEKVAIDDYNTKLATRAAAFASANSGVTAQIYDTGPIINAMLNSPSSYGLQDATSYGTGSQYAWCNDYHISPPVHQKIAQGV
ncbi:hypothetical protein FRB91_007396, partial [Serendipita sp. 411]